MGHAGWGGDTLKAKSALSSSALLALVDSGQEVIRCNFTALAADVAASLGQRLVERGTVRSLDLCYCELGALGVEALAASIARPSGLRQLSLGANAMTARGACAAASLATGLKRLDLEINQLGDEGCKFVSQKVLLRVSTTLQHLDLGMNSIGREGALALAEALGANTALTRLDLGYNRIGSEGAEALAHALMSNTTLKVLRLEDNAVGDLGAAALVSGAGRLHELELAFNQVRAEGAVAVAAALRSHGALRRLGLQGNELRDAGASALAAAISKNCGLQELSLRSSGVGSAGGSALVQALRGNWRLTALDVTENAVTQEAATSIAEMTRQARLVQEEALRAPTIRELTEGTVRRFPTEWSVRAWLGWLSQDAREADVKTMVAVSHAAAVMSSDSDVLSYDLARLRDLASIYGRRLAPGGRLKEAAKGVFLLNLTPFCIQATVGKGSKAVQLKENSGMHLGSDATTIRLALSLSKDSPVWLPQTLPQVVVTPVAGEQSVELPDAEHLRVLSSRWRAEESSHAQLITLLWSWPHRLRGIRFHDLSFWWQGARGAMQGEATDMKSAITRVVLPDTALAQCSLAELYTPGPVQTFVSHHWGQDVDELFKSLSHCSMRAENTRLWICAFSNNHWSPARDEDRLSLSGDALTSRSCHSFVMILGTEAQSLRRLWCLHEALLATQVRGSGRPMVLKLCSPHGLLSEGTGGMPISYILKVSSAISTLDLQIAQCDSAAEKDMLLDAVQRLAGSISAANLRCRQFLQDGLSVMHQRGQQIFVQAVSWLNGTKLSAKEDDAGYSPEQCAVTGDPADSPEPLPASSEEQSRASSKASSPGEEEEEQPACLAERQEESEEVEDEQPACLAERQEESEEVEDEQPAGLADRQEESEESEAALEAPVVSVDRRTSKESTSWQTEDDRRSSEGTDAEADVADAGTEASYEEVRQTQSCESEVEAASGTVESGRPEEGSSRPSSPREGPGSSPPESDESDREGEERQETESEEDSEPPRKRKAPAVDNQDVERSFSESSGSLEDDSEREGSGPDELSQAAPVEVTVVRAPAKEEDDPGTDRGHAGLQQLAPASVPVNGPASPFFRPFPGPDQGDLDTPMPSDADLDDADPCKSPSLTPSFSPEPDAISCFSFGETREKAGYMAAAEASLDQDFSPDASAWREEDLHFARPEIPSWPPPAPQPTRRMPSDPRELADTVAWTVMSSSFSRGVSLDQSPSAAELPSPQSPQAPQGGFAFSRGVSLEQEVAFARITSGNSQTDAEDCLLSPSASFARGFSEDDLAATLMRAFQSLNVERLPLQALLSALGRAEDEASALAESLLPHLPNSEADGCVSCDELTRWLAMPK